VGIVGTLFMGQAIFSFVPQFERRSLILNNFELLLAAFVEAL